METRINKLVQLRNHLETWSNSPNAKGHCIYLTNRPNAACEYVNRHFWSYFVTFVLKSRKPTCGISQTVGKHSPSGPCHHMQPRNYGVGKILDFYLLSSQSLTGRVKNMQYNPSKAQVPLPPPGCSVPRSWISLACMLYRRGQSSATMRMRDRPAYAVMFSMRTFLLSFHS